VLRERKKLNQRGSIVGILGTIALITGGIGIAVTASNRGLFNMLRGLFIYIDSMVYKAPGWAYSIFYEVSYSSILSSLNLSTAAQRLYTLLGIFMLFRLAFAFVKYIINPDGMEKGSGKLMTNLAVSLALIVSTPWIFNRAFELQTYIMDSNVIGNLIMGMNTNTAEDDNFNAGSYGQVISFLTFSAFYHPNSSHPSITSCQNLLNYYSQYVEPNSNDELVVMSNVPDDRRKEAEKIAACVNQLNDKSDISYSDLGDNTVEIGTRFFIASQRYDVSLITHSGVYEAEFASTGTYVVDYSFLVSTIAGGFLALLFLNFCFDVAVRNVKLCFLQIIAPIPIILNIEPGDSKNKPLSWWGKECLRTYVDLFIRVATVYFGVFLINQLFGNGMTVTGSTNTSAMFKVFMILGILLFVKQIPDMIGKAFGIDMKGNFSLNPLKRIGDNRIASMALGGAAGLATGLVGGAYAGFRGARGAGAGVFKSVYHGLGGALGGGMHSMASGTMKGAKSIKDITSNATQNWVRSGRIAESAVGTTAFGRAAAATAMTFGTKTKAQKTEDLAKAIEDYGKGYSEMKNYALSSKEAAGIRRTINGNVYTNVKDANDELERLKASGASPAAIAAAESAVSDMVESYINYYKNKSGHAMQSMWAKNDKIYMDNASEMRKHGISRGVDASSLKSQIGNANNAAVVIRNSKKYYQAQANSNFAKANRGK